MFGLMVPNGDSPLWWDMTAGQTPWLEKEAERSHLYHKCKAESEVGQDYLTSKPTTVRYFHQ